MYVFVPCNVIFPGLHPNTRIIRLVNCVTLGMGDNVHIFFKWTWRSSNFTIIAFILRANCNCALYHSFTVVISVIGYYKVIKDAKDILQWCQTFLSRGPYIYFTKIIRLVSNISSLNSQNFCWTTLNVEMTTFWLTYLCSSK